MAKKIDWRLFPSQLPQSLCWGEEKTLTDEEVTLINEKLARIWEDLHVLKTTMNLGRKRFAERNRD